MKDLVLKVSGSVSKRGGARSPARGTRSRNLGRAARAAALFLALASAPALAGPQDGPYWHITPLVGYAFYDNTTGTDAAPTVTLKDGLYWGGRIGYFFKPSIGLQVQGGSSPTEFEVTGSPKVTYWHAGADVVMVPIRTPKFDVHFLVGAGKGNLDPETGDSQSTTSFDLGAGARWWLSNAIAIHAELRNMLLIPNGGNLSESKDNVVALSGGLTFALGGKLEDTDGDGIPDKKDKCPDTPHGALVNATGCPSDADGDGVFDGIDTCPNTPHGATVNATGCPNDTDGDGIFDGLDQCADTPQGAQVSTNGCPIDSDGDGVPDGIDRCPNTPTGATIDPQGCPHDTDGDGVPEGIDKCPSTPAGVRVDVDGCPIEVTERETQFLDTGMMRIQDIQFATGKSEIPASTNAQLDQVGAILAKWPELKIEVGGHTDSRGSTPSNQKLSEDRANAVLQYLEGKFPTLKDEQFSVKGYGESKPLVKNTSAANMAKNRRVEFKVLNKDVLKKEVERRKTLTK